jgi:spore maturation protein CgeB
LQRDGERLTTKETVMIFNATEINLNLHSSVCHDGVNPFGDFVNPRTFEIASCGSFQLVDYRSMINRHFNIGEEMVCYSCLEELREQVHYYLKHYEERMAIAHRARERILKEHTYEHRMRELLFFIRERKPECFCLKGKNAPVVRDVHAFCAEHPEVGPILESAGKGGAIDIDQILSVVNSGRGSLQYHEAIFLLIKDFHDLFGRTGV